MFFIVLKFLGAKVRTLFYIGITQIGLLYTNFAESDKKGAKYIPLLDYFPHLVEAIAALT